MTRADRMAIAKYLMATADRLPADSVYANYYDNRTKHPEPKSIRDEIAQLRKWAKMLKEDT